MLQINTNQQSITPVSTKPRCLISYNHDETETANILLQIDYLMSNKVLS